MKYGKLYVVATPIGNLADITARAQQVLQSVSLIAAEDTRHSAKLLQYLAINTPLISLHEHNEKQRMDELLKKLQAGMDIALISDAGTPLISDPGQQFVASARHAGIVVLTIPGPSALIAALSVAGLPADEFYFGGFLPTKTGARQQRLKQLKNFSCTLAFYEAPHRILDLITDMMTVFGSQRYVVITRELTKLHETSYGATLETIYHWLQQDVHQQKGEFVVIVQGAAEETAVVPLTSEQQRVLELLVAELPLQQAVQLAVKITGLKKNLLYQTALHLKEQS